MKNHFERICNKAVWLFLLTPLLMLAAGCHKDAVQVYQIANDQNQTAQPTAPATNLSNQSMPSGLPTGNPSVQMPAGVVASDVQNAPPVKWTTPAGWTEVPPSEMRVGSFKITGADGKQADVSIVPLPGLAGGDPANVNRWRGQVNLPALPEDALAKLTEDVQAGGQPAELYDIAGENQQTGQAARILAVIQHRDGITWFFKMTGDGDLVEQQKPAFVSFLGTLNFAASQAQPQMPAGHPDIGDMGNASTLPAGHPDVGSMTEPSAGPVSTAGQPTWQVPADWKAVSAGQFLVAKFMIIDPKGATAAVNVSSAPGDGGGLAPNVNRWRGQLGLAPADEISTTIFAVPNGQAQMVDFSGTNAKTGQSAQLVGIMVTQPGQTWFYKLMGDPIVVAAQKDAFTQFVKGVKY